MTWYVTLHDGQRGMLALGPFTTHTDALRHVRPLRVWLQRHTANGHAFSVGTMRRDTTEPGQLNSDFGLRLGVAA
jgi:hypothetical protein